MKRFGPYLILIALTMFVTVLSPTAATRAQDDPAVTGIELPGLDEPSEIAAANAGWAELGVGSATGFGISNNAGDSDVPSLAIGLNGLIAVAWQDESGGDAEIYTKYWSGAAWSTIGPNSASGGGISNNAGDSKYPVVAFGKDGNPVVAWADNTGGADYDVYVRRWNGASWVEVGAGSAIGSGVSNTVGQSYEVTLAIGTDNNPIVAWSESPGGGADSEIYIRRFDGAVWSTMGANSASGGGISNNAGTSEHPSLAIGPSGNPIIAWVDSSGGNDEVYVRRWNGTTWVEMGAGSATGGGMTGTAAASREPSLATNADGIPTIAWAESTNNGLDIYVLAWDGSKWAEVGAGSASAGGISNNAGASRYPSLAIGLDRKPVVAWTDNTTGNLETYVRRWNGSTWAEMAVGSATAGGVSNPPVSSSEQPSLAFGPNGIPVVTWSRDDTRNKEIYVRIYTAGPRITGFTPGSGQVGATISIKGTNLTGTTAVLFNGTSAVTYSNVSATQVTAMVPTGATTGKITLFAADGVAVSTADFTVNPPAPIITSFTPAYGPIGATVTISGKNFVNASSVQIGAKAALFTVVDDTQITAIVPVGSKTGKKIAVITPSGIALSTYKFTVLFAPTIGRFAPTSGPVGTLVAISGKNLTRATVAFNGISARVTTNTATKIVVTVPVGATTGPITITTPGGEVTSTTNFTVR